MCLAVPLKIIAVENDHGVVDINGDRKEINLILIENPVVGEYVIVHAGFAINRLNEIEAEETLKEIQKIYHNITQI